MSHPDTEAYPHRPSTSSSDQFRKFSRQTTNDIESTPDKQERAHERQRWKWEREQMNVARTLHPQSISDVNLGSRNPESGISLLVNAKRNRGGKKICLDNLPPDEAHKKQRLREAARERQRKHRAGVKAKRMAELGMTIVNQGGRIEQTAIGYTINEHGQYEAVLANPNLQHPGPSPLPGPQTPATPGQMFASTLLLGLSCTPHLKQQLLRTLRSTNEEFASFEPYMAAAFDHWDHGRSLHCVAQGHHHVAPQTPPAPYAVPYAPFNERFLRPSMGAYPGGPWQDRDRSASQSDDGDSDAQIEPGLSHVPPGASRDGMPIVPPVTDEMQGKCDRGGGEANDGEEQCADVGNGGE